MLQVKICGLISLDDSVAAIEAGADFLGFNFYPPSPRYIPPETCARIVQYIRQRTARPITLVGVFVNLSPVKVRAILDSCDLDLAQFSGDETPADLAVLGPERAFKALRPEPGISLLDACRRYPLRRAPPACLVDAHVSGQYGGTGQVADWRQARRLAEQCALLLAGGLTPANVGQAVQLVAPWGVDVASGVEREPGRKDYSLMRAFVAAARQAEKEYQL